MKRLQANVYRDLEPLNCWQFFFAFQFGLSNGQRYTSVPSK